jgi:diguanylate cyclase (GGDEF)-like protein/PAS domain S-box-containing protein
VTPTQWKMPFYRPDQGSLSDVTNSVRLRLVPLLCVAAIAIFALLTSLNEGDDPVWSAFSNIGQLAAATFAFVLCVSRTKRERLAFLSELAQADEESAPSRWQTWMPWALLAAGVGAWALGQLGWTIYESGFGVTPPAPSPLDIAFLASPLLVVVGLLAMVRTPAGYLSQLRGVIEGLFIAAGVFLCSWSVISPVVGHGELSTFGEAVNLAYPLLDAVALTAVLFVALRRDEKPPAGLVLLGLGIVCVAVSDSAFWYLSAVNPSFPGASPEETGWVAGFLLIGLAALQHKDPKAWAHRLIGGRHVLALPALPAAAGIVSVLVRWLSGGDLGSMGALLTIVTVMVLLGVLLLVVVAYENQVLTANLERLVDRRTAELNSTERYYRALVQQSSDMVMVVNPDLSIRYVSDSITNIFEFRPEQLIGQRLEAFGPKAAKTLTDALEQLGIKTDRVARVSWDLTDGAGRQRQAESTITNLLADPNVGAFVLNTRDETERAVLAEQLRRRAFHDPLTELPNRALLADRAAQAFARSQRTGKSVAVMVVDLDAFKLINDGFGHQAGDLLLSAVAKRLGQAIRPEDTAARLGGDEFVVLMESIETTEDAMTLAERVHYTLSEKFVIGDNEHHISASVGVAIGANPHTNFDQLISDADVALYVVKGAGKNGVQLYQSDMHKEASERFKLQGELREALEKEEFWLLYQPQFSSDGKQLEGFEALVRWNHPVHGLMPPERFIPLAEETGLIVPLGRWVLEQALRQLAAWDRTTPVPHPPSMSVNVSAIQLNSASWLSDVQSTLRRYGIAPQRLILEITESTLIESSKRLTKTLQTIKDMGVRLAIDDFGTGYASVSYLRDLPVDILKVDKSFVASSGDGRGRELLEAIVNIGHVLSLVTIAEGIEQPSQLDTIRAAGCDVAQGFLLSKPLAHEQAQRLIAQYSRPGALITQR